MKTFEQFTEEIVMKIKEFLPENFANAQVEIHSVIKNNDLKLTGLTIHNADSNICPTIYLNDYYNDYKSGEEMNSILTKIADVRVRKDIKNVFDVNDITVFDNVKNKIIPRLVNKEWNKNLLKERPHKVIAGDLAVTYHVIISQNLDGVASTAITYALMEKWEANTDILHEAALRNMTELLPSTFRSITSVLEEMKGNFEEPSQDDGMYVLSNKQKFNGSSALLDKEIMQKIVDRFGENFYILPSSVHECIVVAVPEDMNIKISEISEMIKQINAMEVEPDIRLSDHPYKYTVEGGLFSVGGERNDE